MREEAQKPAFPFDITKKIDEMLGTLEAEIYDENWTLVKRLPVRELPDFLTTSGDSIYAIILDGITTQRIVDLAAKKGVKIIVTARTGPLTKVPENMQILTFDQLKKVE